MLNKRSRNLTLKKGFLCIVFILFIAHCSKQVQHVSIVKGPYLQQLQQTEMTIVWECDTAYAGKVYYGIDETLDNVAETIEPLKIQKVVLKNLEPETEYAYQVEVNGFMSDKYTFRTAVKENSAFTFAAYGDNKNGPFNHQRLTDLILTYKPLFVVNNGDLVAEGYIYEQWEKLFFTPARHMIANIPFVPAIGNHERNSAYYYNYFCMPNNKAWFSFDINGAHFVVINTEYKSLMGSDEQVNWLIDDLKNNQSVWTFVFQHRPPFTSGGNYYSNSRVNMKNLLHPIYEKYGVDMVLGGHDHHYERTKPVGSKTSEHGVTYIVGGNGGTPMRYIGKPKDFSLTSTRTFGFSLMEIDGQKLTFKEMSIDNTILDEFVLDKSDSASVAAFMKHKIEFSKIHDPVKASKLYNEGKKLHRKSKYVEAVEVLLQAYEIDGECEEATAMLADCYYILGDYENARKFAEITIEIAPLHPDSYQVIASIYNRKKEYDEAIKWLKKQFAVEPDSPSALKDIAGIYESRKEYKKAIATYKEAINVLPNAWSLHFKLAELYEEQGKESKALNAYKLARYWFFDDDDDDYVIVIDKIKELSK